MSEDSDRKFERLHKKLKAINEGRKRKKGKEHPKKIGPYKILDVLGEGGMGVVYLAKQKGSVHQKVALKLIKPGMDSKAVIARFESERQVLAVMDHPSIARVLDAGTSKRGRLFFVMEYVQGVPLTQYCDQNKLTIKERLGLFILICESVQHAHQKGIIHRDLKPSNILVVLHNDRPLPKVIDFGLAKATGAPLTNKTLLTARGVFLGTPAYMCPEQTGLTGLDIDTRADIYALGVILYELLTGDLPFDLTEAVRKAAYDQIRRRICEEDPPKPSTRITSMGERIADLARKRDIDPGSLPKKLRGDLDWITMKALEKVRTRRYSTSTELAADIRRHLNDEPVTAGPPSTIYRLRKFARKNRGAVLTIVAIFVAVLAGGSLATVFYFRARKNLENFHRLSDVKRLDQLLEQADQLWPAHPEMIQPIGKWLTQARSLERNLDEHRSFLQTLRAKSSDPNPSSSRRARSKAEVPNAAWLFDKQHNQWMHDVLAELVHGLEEFVTPETGTIAEMERRLCFARSVGKESVDNHREAWDKAIASIAEKEVYKGLQIKAQIGLVPIGPDQNSGLWEFGHLQTGSIANRAADGNLVLNEHTGLVFVLIPGGEFLMGAQNLDRKRPNFDPLAEDDESPVRRVSLDPFFLSKYEMTQGQWVRVTNNNPSFIGPDEYRPEWNRAGNAWSGLHPVEAVSWEDCAGVVRRLGLVLPTEAQWEYAARGMTDDAWWTGDEVESLTGAGNVADAFAKQFEKHWVVEESVDDGFLHHAPIGSLAPNPFGLHDVIGNVWEWCHDRYRSYRHRASPSAGAVAATPRERSDSQRVDSHVVRGGSFKLMPKDNRSANRWHVKATRAGIYLGLRPARFLE